MSCSDKMHSKKLDIVTDVDEPKKKSKRRKKIIIKDMKQEINKKKDSKKSDIVVDVDKPKKKSKRRKKIIIISNEDNKIKDMKQEINKKRKELEELTMCLKKKQVFVDKKKNKIFTNRVQNLPDVLISIIFRYAISPHASKKEIVDVYNEREKLRIQWERWEQLPHPRQPHFETFEADQEYMNLHPGIDIYEIQREVSNKNDPCSMTYMPDECIYNGNILMGRVKISVGFSRDTRVEDVNTLRWDSLNECGLRNCKNVDIETYYSKTTWRGNNETGTYNQQKKKKSNYWVYGWGPIRIDNIKTRDDGIISISFIDDLWYPSRRNLLNELKYINDYGVKFTKIQKLLEKNGFDVSKLGSRYECWCELIST